MSTVDAHAELTALAAEAERRYVERNPESRRLHGERARVMPGGNSSASTRRACTGTRIR